MMAPEAGEPHPGGAGRLSPIVKPIPVASRPVLLTVAALLVGTAFGLATGGKLRYAARRRIHWWPLIAAGFGLEVAADRWLSGAPGYLALVAGPVCLLVWAARNAAVAGMGLVALGVAANLGVISVDRGMPVERSALVSAGIAPPRAVVISVSGHRHHVVRPGDHLRFLDDRIPLAVAHEVVSVGDLILAAGMAVVVVQLLWYQGRYQRVRHPRWRMRRGLVPPVDDLSRTD
jgi:hypothetical protein